MKNDNTNHNNVEISSVPRAGWSTYAGLFLVTLATLTYEILLTRIFSVSMRYHFAFMAISIALFGITAGAAAVYALPRLFPISLVKNRASAAALLFGLWMIVSLFIHLAIPHEEDSGALNSFIVLTYIVVSIPFVFCGVCITLVLTQYSGQVSKLYAFDLLGSSLGCVLLVALLQWMDGLNAVVFCGFVASAGAVMFAVGSRSKALRIAALAGCAAIGVFLCLNLALTAKGGSLLRMRWIKGHREVEQLLYEKWNSFSRIRVYGEPDAKQWPLDMGGSTNIKPTEQISRIQLDIDSDASTELLKFSGDLKPFSYLRNNIVNLAHRLRSGADVCVIGSGGGRDIVSALVFNQKSVLGIEINQDIVKAVNGKFGGYTGHLDRNPKVKIVADEARSYITRSPEKYDILQVSMIDTWAATAAGAFVLSENSLYTVEAWKVFLSRLKPHGILSFCRWYYAIYPAEMFRLISLAETALDESGAGNPREHILAAKVNPHAASGLPLANGFGVVLVSRDPFSAEDIQVFRDACFELGFEIILTPEYSAEPIFAKLASGVTHDSAVANLRLNATAPTDDSPFFFNMVRLRNLFNPRSYEQGELSFNMKAVTALCVLLITVTVLSALFILVPVLISPRDPCPPGSLPLFVYFASIGLGFMLIEVSQMQRLIVYLGHPTYGLTVILFSLLLSSGLGSLSTRNVDPAAGDRRAFNRIALLFLAVTVFGFITTHLLSATRGQATPIRIFVAAAILFPMGFCMGNAFPLGMKAAATHWKPLAPVLFGLNGAMSVFASVAAVAIALFSSISISFWAGALCYLAAYASFTRIARQIANIKVDAPKSVDCKSA